MMEIHPTPRWRRRDVELFLLDEADVGGSYVGWLNDPRVNRYLESRFEPHGVDSTRRFVAACRHDPQALLLGIRSVALDARHVGNIKLGPIDRRHGLAEVGILVGDPMAWGRGVATSAIEALSAIARDELGLRKLTAGCYAENLGSARAFQKAGFEIEGTRRAHLLLDGCPHDLILLAMWLRPSADPAT